MISLRDAKGKGELESFIVEQEAIAHVVKIKEFNRVVQVLAKSQPQQDQTSGSRVRGGSTGK
jgi:hypothetical protein